jgi:hypothetical protein
MREIIERSKARKIELEWIKEKQLERERAFEGKQFEEKDHFVTASYRRALEEKQKVLQALKAQDKKDEKQNLSDDFYRHLLKQTERKS